MDFDVSPAGRTVLELNGVSKRYATSDGRSVDAVSTASLSVNRGEFISILGPSGCGKSTLLMMAAGLVDPTAGTVAYYDDKGVQSASADLAVVFQDALLFPWRTAIENVKLPAEIAAWNKGDSDRRAKELLALVGLAGFENKYPRELSGGMQQRAAIARSLMRNPQIILMDEPFGALDAISREQLNLAMQKISHETGASFLLVTHSITEAAFLSDKVVVMSKRPSQIVRILDIDIPKPRASTIMNSEALNRYVSELRRILDISGDPS